MGYFSINCSRCGKRLKKPRELGIVVNTEDAKCDNCGTKHRMVKWQHKILSFANELYSGFFIYIWIVLIFILHDKYDFTWTLSILMGLIVPIFILYIANLILSGFIQFEKYKSENELEPEKSTIIYLEGKYK